MIRKALVALSLIIVTAGVVTLPGTAASAHNQGESTSIKVDFKRIGYNVEIANEHGYMIVNRNGRLESVKVADHPIQPQALVIDSAPVVEGNCGIAFLYYTATGGRHADVYTGFDLTSAAPAIDTVWKVSVTDNIGVGSDQFFDWVFGYSWDMTWHTSHGTTGYSWAIITSGTAFLADGSECWAGPAWDDTYLY